MIEERIVLGIPGLQQISSERIARVNLAVAVGMTALAVIAAIVAPVPGGIAFLFPLIALLPWLDVYRLKRVRMDDDFLYVSDLFREARIPLAEVDDVRRGWWDRGYELAIKLRSDTTFGRSISYVPRGTIYSWGPTSDTELLLARAERARREPAESTSASRET